MPKRKASALVSATEQSPAAKPKPNKAKKRSASSIEDQNPTPTPATSSPAKKQKRTPKPNPHKAKKPNASQDQEPEDNDPFASEEKRAKRFRAAPTVAWLQRYDRAVSQRMFVISRTSTLPSPPSPSSSPPSSSDPSTPSQSTAPTQTITLAGTTGNIYRVQISTIPHCTCPDFWRGNECKHIIYVLSLVLKAPDHLIYQAAFLKSELESIFASAPSVDDLADGHGTKDENGRRDPEGDCPICFMPLVDEVDGEKGRSANADGIVWCRATCGNNIHKECFSAWARSQKAKGEKVSCVYCRSAWQEDVGATSKEMSELAKSVEGRKKDKKTGYVNVAKELGLSGKRDSSSYYSGPGAGVYLD